MRVGELVESAMEQDAPPVSRNLFDEIMDETESLLIQNVFKGFHHSIFYREYKEAVVLSSNLVSDKN